MKMSVIRVSGVIGGLLFAALCIWLGLFREIIQPYVTLPDRIRLISYLNYMALIAGPIIMLGLSFVCCHQLFYPTRDRFSYGGWWKIIIVLTVIVAALAFFNRLYLGYKIDQASYIQCTNESRTSAKSSWRVYAKNENLCKS
ncbi:hypothetical protein AB4430_19100 [Vibrio kanaloae]|uniref:hypothetical protein n=1 Tax=Vibrio kanaloae TaxID=170673 RepID=UPI00354BF6FE